MTTQEIADRFTRKHPAFRVVRETERLVARQIVISF